MDGLCVWTDPKSSPSEHSFLNKLGRVAWGATWLLFFRPSPKPFYAWRRMLLRLFGAKVAVGARVLPSVKIWVPWNLTLGRFTRIGDGVDCYCVGPVTLGDYSTVSQRAFLCGASHDVSDPTMSLVVRPINIGASAWVCAEAFVGPGVTVGKGAVVAARGVAVKDVEPWTVVGGNPVRFLRKRVLKRVTDTTHTERHGPPRRPR
ncbi:MAG: putative colanic acid biosynthesis acetyltransferase [Planctomycetaceae bacterium]|nr:putative colanic acid biosynthesis acetyltransferase [Planctomycetaceae bacterium]